MDDLKDGRNSEGQFVTGNAIWRGRTCHGRPRVFEDGESLWAAYWCNGWIAEVRRDGVPGDLFSNYTAYAPGWDR